jgi:hypothetical protein
MLKSKQNTIKIKQKYFPSNYKGFPIKIKCQQNMKGFDGVWYVFNVLIVVNFSKSPVVFWGFGIFGLTDSKKKIITTPGGVLRKKAFLKFLQPTHTTQLYHNLYSYLQNKHKQTQTNTNKHKHKQTQTNTNKHKQTQTQTNTNKHKQNKLKQIQTK